MMMTGLSSLMLATVLIGSSMGTGRRAVAAAAVAPLLLNAGEVVHVSSGEHRLLLPVALRRRRWIALEHLVVHRSRRPSTVLLFAAAAISAAWIRMALLLRVPVANWLAPAVKQDF